MARLRLICLAVAAGAGGCFWSESTSWLAPQGPYPGPQPTRQLSYAPSASETAARVEAVGRKIVAANSDLGMQPLFHTIGTSRDGAPPAEVFHVGTNDLYITETLVAQCTTEEQLAAVLCHELGKMLAEREALAGPKTRAPEREPPMQVLNSTDYVGSFGGPPDLTNLAERNKFDRAQPRPVVTAAPDPRALARRLLTQAGFRPEELDAAGPLLRQAARASTFEKQFTQPTAVGSQPAAVGSQPAAVGSQPATWTPQP